MSSTLSLRTPHLPQPLAALLSSAAARVSAWMRPRPASPVEAAAYLRALANRFDDQPDFAADLRAAADRHEQEYGIQ
jgi:hypothetical protein